MVSRNVLNNMTKTYMSKCIDREFSWTSHQNLFFWWSHRVYPVKAFPIPTYNLSYWYHRTTPRIFYMFHIQNLFVGCIGISCLHASNRYDTSYHRWKYFYVIECWLVKSNDNLMFIIMTCQLENVFRFHNHWQSALCAVSIEGTCYRNKRLYIFSSTFFIIDKYELRFWINISTSAYYM